jgi:hypothetical protein
MDRELPQITAGMAALRRDNPWPALPEDVEPFYLSLDGGGRHLITDVIRANGVRLMLEVGCFLCGSTRQWLESSPDLTVIGADPWDGNWSVHLRMRADEGNQAMAMLPDPYATADLIQEHGNFVLALNNIQDHRARFIPVRQRSPEVLHYLRRRGIIPDLIYIDAKKEEDDLWEAHRVFPRAILCGDDWNWVDEHGAFRMRDHVERFARECGFDVTADRATWILSPRAPAGPSRAYVPPAPRTWDRASAKALLEEVDERGVELLGFIATAAHEGRVVTFDDAGRHLGCDRGSQLLVLREINGAHSATGRPRPIGLGENGGSTGWGSVGPRPYLIAGDLAQAMASIEAES